MKSPIQAIIDQAKELLDKPTNEFINGIVVLHDQVVNLYFKAKNFLVAEERKIKATHKFSRSEFRFLADIIIDMDETFTKLIDRGLELDINSSELAVIERKYHKLVERIRVVVQKFDKSIIFQEPMIDGYFFQRLIMRTANSIIYRGWSDELEQVVCIKIISKILHGKQAANDEIMMLEKASECPGVIQLLKHFEFGDFFFLIFDFYEDGTLTDLVERSPKLLSESTTSSIMYQLIKILDNLHARGIWHRDIKPENIFVKSKSDDNIEIVLGDFGLACMSNVKYMGKMGTLSYMAPESIMGKTLDEKIDIWGAGMVFLYLLTRKLPWGSKRSSEDKENAILHAEVYIDNALKNTNERAARIVRNLLRTNPDERCGLTEIAHESFFTQFLEA